MSPETTIVIADDHPIFRRGLRHIIEAEPGFRILAEAEEGASALAQLKQHRPAVAVLDVDMPGLDGFEVVRALRRENVPSGIVFLTMHKDEDLFNEALNAGVQGYVVKDSAVVDIVASIHAVAAGQYFITPSISTYLVNRSRRVEALSREKPAVDRLTATERRILKLIAEHRTNKEVAGELFISHRTVENHRANICEKLDLHGSHALLRFALDHKSHLL